MEEILHQLVDGQNPIVIPSFTVLHSYKYLPTVPSQLVQDFFHPQ
jgi:hypothetical protein